jgi:hypothetical protein
MRFSFPVPEAASDFSQEGNSWNSRHACYFSLNGHCTRLLAPNRTIENFGRSPDVHKGVSLQDQTAAFTVLCQSMMLLVPLIALSASLID